MKKINLQIVLMVLQLTLTTILLFSMIGCKKETPKHDFTLHYHAHCKSSPFKVRYVSGLNEKSLRVSITLNGQTTTEFLRFNNEVRTIRNTVILAD